jgi:NADPH:quinone reductase-like Zn-dependent oxidoreductase
MILRLVITLVSSGSMVAVGLVTSVSARNFEKVIIHQDLIPNTQLQIGMASDEPLCGQALLSGYTVDGTFQQYCIGKAAHVARIPKEVKLDAIAPVLCAGITVSHQTSRGEIVIG